MTPDLFIEQIKAELTDMLSRIPSPVPEAQHHATLRDLSSHLQSASLRITQYANAWVMMQFAAEQPTMVKGQPQFQPMPGFGAAAYPQPMPFGPPLYTPPASFAEQYANGYQPPQSAAPFLMGQDYVRAAGYPNMYPRGTQNYGVEQHRVARRMEEEAEAYDNLPVDRFDNLTFPDQDCYVLTHAYLEREYGAAEAKLYTRLKDARENGAVELFAWRFWLRSLLQMNDDDRVPTALCPYVAALVDFDLTKLLSLPPLVGSISVVNAPRYFFHHFVTKLKEGNEGYVVTVTACDAVRVLTQHWLRDVEIVAQARVAESEKPELYLVDTTTAHGKVWLYLQENVSRQVATLYKDVVEATEETLLPTWRAYIALANASGEQTDVMNRHMRAFLVGDETTLGEQNGFQSPSIRRPSGFLHHVMTYLYASPIDEPERLRSAVIEASAKWVEKVEQMAQAVEK